MVVSAIGITLIAAISSIATAISCIAAAGSSSPAGHGGGAATATMMTVAGNGFRRHRDCATSGCAATITSFESPALAGLSESVARESDLNDLHLAVAQGK